MPEESLIVRGAREHNLRNIDVTIPRDRLTVITGLSGSGKSSLAFDTIYAEGQRRYVESLSAYARQFLGLMEKPDVDSIEGTLAGHLHRAEDRRPQPEIDRRDGHRDLRLPATPLRARRNSALPQLRTPRRAPERRTDRRFDPHLARRNEDRDPRAARARPQRRIPRAVRGRAQAGLRARDRRRRPDRGRKSAEAQSADEPQHLGRRRPAGRARRKIAGVSTIPSRPRSSLPKGSSKFSAPTIAASTSSPRSTAAPSAASRCPSSSRGTSRSTRRSAPAPPAADSAPAAR